MTDAAALGPLSSMDPFAAERAPGSRPQYADVVRIRSLLEQSRFSAVIAAWPENVGYLSGFYHPDMRVNWERLHLVIWPSGGDPAYVIPRPRADNWNGKTAPPFIGPEESTPVIDDIRGYDGEELEMVRVAAEVLADRHVTRGLLGLEFRTLPVKVGYELSRILPSLRHADAWPLFNEMRKRKTAAEVDVLHRANLMTAKALEHALAHAQPGQSEREVASGLASALYAAGADELSHTVLSAGQRSRTWHPWPSSQILEEGMLIRADWGVRIDGYTSDIARTAVVGRASRATRDTFARICDVHDLVVAAVRPGVLASELVVLAKREYARRGLEYRWGLAGHGVGLVIHEEPQLLADVHEPIVPGMTLEIELGYFGEREGYHIEDLVYVTDHAAVNLTRGEEPRRLIESGR